MLSAMQTPAPPGFERRAFAPQHVRARKTHFEFPATTPRWWVGGSPTRTHVMNSLHMFLPAFERMIMRTVLDHIVPMLDDPELVKQARGLAGQEASHSRAHERFLDNLRAQGYQIDRFLAFTEWAFEDLLEKRLGPRMAISVVSGFEHYTDILVLLVLQGDFLDGCDPALHELLTWHAAEEVEHNAIAWQVLEAIGGGYGLRMVGSVVSLATILGVVLAGTLLLLGQDRLLTERRTLRELLEFFVTKHHVVQDVVKLFLHYARPGYRPDDIDYGPLARDVLEPRAA